MSTPSNSPASSDLRWDERHGPELADLDAVTVDEAQGEVKESFQKKQLRDVDAAPDTYMGKRGATALPPENPPQPVLNTSWGFFLTEQTPLPQTLFLRKEDTNSGI